MRRSSGVTSATGPVFIEYTPALLGTSVTEAWRYFAGMNNEEIAEAFGISVSTVKNYWTFSRTWLLHAGRGSLCCIAMRVQRKIWWACSDLNREPRHYECHALTIELQAQHNQPRRVIVLASFRTEALIHVLSERASQHTPENEVFAFDKAQPVFDVQTLAQ